MKQCDGCGAKVKVESYDYRGRGDPGKRLLCYICARTKMGSLILNGAVSDDMNVLQAINFGVNYLATLIKEAK